jgi:hypothetical protein
MISAAPTGCRADVTRSSTATRTGVRRNPAPRNSRALAPPPRPPELVESSRLTP